ncbi:peptidoglycan/xylan/chitin deacetylase (PgdA/CDA1 family) [Bradyrhizobium sp. i1.15.2]
MNWSVFDAGSSPRHMRAPYGIWTKEALAASAKAKLAALHWSVDPQDWSRPGVEAIVAAVLASLQPGAIVLLTTDAHPTSWDAALMLVGATRL